ncbi:MAG: carbon storage regulator [Tepidibacter sp.]|jgi:carbon storage regulator|uniref:carbon storage regulator n=1 Tax=Tepidibacter sp. TaxID=2529387 RepID=UPI0025DC3BF2|nr:carbon storage regulator [Tepidibacter sp.]MCT4509058.1 carbon storage regulator [Tepidibacter sp.]
MLVLGRKPEEYIVIDGSIKVKVIRSENGQLRLGIDVPRNMKVIRGEIWEAVYKK